MPNAFEFFIGIDWGSERHRVCVIDPAGAKVEERWIEHSGESLAELVTWLRRLPASSPDQIAVAIELPRGPVVETLMEQGFAVFSINPKQLDRFRDRYSPAGAKDDRRDAFVLEGAARLAARWPEVIRRGRKSAGSPPYRAIVRVTWY